MIPHIFQRLPAAQVIAARAGGQYRGAGLITPAAGAAGSKGSTRMANILVIDDDPGIRELMADYLGRNGHRVDTAEDGVAMQRALDARGADYDLLILDVMMPGEDGLSIAARLAGTGGPAIILLSAMGDDDDRIRGLDIGADDYLPKPCNPRELLARVAAVLRRHSSQAEPQAEAGHTAEFAGWTLDLVRRELRSPTGMVQMLTEGEFLLMRALLERPGEVLEREELLQQGSLRSQLSDDRSIDVQMSRLRRKLERGGDEVQLIRTVRNRGYRFDVPVVRH